MRRFVKAVYIYWMERAFGMKRWNIFIKAVLYPFSLFYILGGYLRKFSKKFRPSNIKVISVGSPFAGGTGKTMISILLTKELIKRGYKVCYLQKDYRFFGRKRNADEFLEAIHELGGDLVFESHSPVEFIKEEDKKKRFDFVVLDDGFTNPKILKHINITTFDGEILFGNGMVLPLGPMKVPLRELKYADIFIFKGKVTKRLELSVPSISIDFSPESLIELKTGKIYPPDFISGKEVVIFCGIGNRSSFHKLVQRLGANVKKIHIFPDHHRYKEKDIKMMLKEGEIFLTTVKDSKRLVQYVEMFPLIYAVKLKWMIPENELSYLLKMLER